MDVTYIADVLKAVVIESTDDEYPGHSVRLVSPDLSTRLRLEISVDDVRLFVEQLKLGGLTLVGVVTLHDVESVAADFSKEEVRFMGKHSELTINKRAVFSVSVLP